MTGRIIATQRPTQPAGYSRIAGRGLGRRGITLIETVVLMTGVAAMLGLTVLMLQLLLKLDGDSRARFDSAGMLGRLAEQFRRDVHGAGAARLVEQPSRSALLRIEPGPDRAIEYQVKGQSRVIRVESIKGKLVRNESYEIARGGPIEFALKQEGGRRFATLTVDRQASKNRTDPPRLFEILAQVGRNRDRVAAAAPAAGGTP
jgi:hypothetical protein